MPGIDIHIILHPQATMGIDLTTASIGTIITRASKAEQTLKPRDLIGKK